MFRLIGSVLKVSISDSAYDYYILVYLLDFYIMFIILAVEFLHQSYA